MIKFTVLAFVLAATCVSPAAAQDIRVHYADLDLNRARDVEEFNHRVEVQAKDWCSGQSMVGSMLRDPFCVSMVARAVVMSLPAHDRQAYAAAARDPSRQVAMRNAD